jgi:DNA polymerase-3 subunit gamma/tau
MSVNDKAPYEVIARKWRPQVFQDVVGQEHVTQTLINAIKANRIAHAYIFGGPRGVGKTSVARIFAKAVNCSEGEPGTPCNRCRSCLEITEGSSVDVQEIDGASNRGIDEIRELRENIRYLPSSGKYRVYIIDEVHMLTLPAFNALLKTLEEPPSHVKFIFATTESHKVPVTILSRCQRFDFKRIPLERLVEQLKKICDKEGINVGEASLRLVARAAEGSMRDAQSLLDQVISFAGFDVHEDTARHILGIISSDILLSASAAVIEGDIEECLKIVDRLYSQGYDLKEFYKNLMEQFRNLLFSALIPDFRPGDATEGEAMEIRAQARKAGETRLKTALDILIHREESLRQTSHPKLILEATLIKLCTIGDLLSVGEILNKIAMLEKGFATPYHAGRVTEGGVSSSGPATLPPPPSGPKGSLEGRWPDFLKRISSKNKVLCSMLQQAVVKEAGEDTVRLELAQDSFSAGYLSSQDTIAQLGALLRDFFGRVIKIEIGKIPSPQNLRQKDSAPSKGAVQDLASSPPVQRLISVFEGEIMKDKGNNKEGTKG